jgi:hypothetical protein
LAHWIQFLLLFSFLHILPLFIMHNCTPFLSCAVQYKPFTYFMLHNFKIFVGWCSEVSHRSKIRWLISFQMWKLRLAEYSKDCWDDFSDIICLYYHQRMLIKDFLMILNWYLYAKKLQKSFFLNYVKPFSFSHRLQAEYNWKNKCISTYMHIRVQYSL